MFQQPIRMERLSILRSMTVFLHGWKNFLFERLLDLRPPLPCQALRLGDMFGGHILFHEIAVLSRLFQSLGGCQAKPQVAQNVVLRYA